MKDMPPSRHGVLRVCQLGLLALMMPLAIGSTAQDTGQWSDAALPVPVVDTLQNVFPAPVDGRPDQRPPPARVLPLPVDFDVRELEAMALAISRDDSVAGLAMAIVHDGRVLSARGYGVTDVNNPEPVDAHTVFRLASLSKSFAGTMAGVLVNDGALRWDNRVVDYMPGFRMADPGAAQQITVADVLTHRVGLGRHTFDRDIERGAEYTALVQRLADAPMRCAPGDCYEYQNVAFSLVGDVVFATSGQFFSEAVASRLFRPLGMHTASYGLEGIQASERWARPHVRSGRRLASLTPKPTYYRLAPAAGVNASISDMAQWLLAHSGHRPDVLPAPLLATLHAPLVGTPGDLQTRSTSWRHQRLNAAGYGMGWRIYDYAGHRVVFHGGAVQGYRGVMALMPERDFGFVILWNSESALPSGMLPTILDRAIGLNPERPWLDVNVTPDLLYALDGDSAEEDGQPAAGVSSSSALAEPF